jgi:tetratricopeptide (TPR) repeat protein
MCFIVALGLCISAFAQTPAASAGHEVALLPEAGAIPAPAQSTEQTPAPDEPPPEREFRIALAPADSLSAADMIALATEYGWNEDPETERAWLEAAAGLAASTDTGLATVLLAEATLPTGDLEKALALLEWVRTEYKEPELIAFADLVEGFAGLTPVPSGHGKRLYADFTVMRDLCASAASQWPGTFLGGWASIRLAAVYRGALDQPDQAVLVLEDTAEDYVGTPFREYALEDLAAAITFSFGRFVEGRILYEDLLATTSSDFIGQRATLHLGELLMDTEEYDGAHDRFDEFIRTWPQHGDSVGAVMLRGYVASRLNKWDEAIADANRYLSVTAANLPVYTGKAHLALGRAAYAQGDLGTAETEFALVNDEFLTPEGKAGVGYCRADRGDLRGAMSAFLEAAALADPRNAPSHYYQAARLAQKLGDRNAYGQILSRLIAEFPASQVTSLLAGREILPPPSI